MVFGGLQKVTLLDYPEKTACTLFTTGCNFRCAFCQNSSLLVAGEGGQAISEADVLSFLESRVGLLDGVCISGGEPLLNDDIDGFIGKLKAMGFLVKLDTNGNEPEALRRLVSAGVIDYVAMDIKNSPDKYALTIGVPGYDISPVKESIEFLQSCGVSYEFRTTVVREFHTADDLLTVAAWLCDAEKYFLQGFINSDGVLKSGLSGYSSVEMRDLLDTVKAELPTAELRGV